ncbi:tripartite tricarboxylate transporter TctB family protein [Marinomonas arenicola]|uniref:tripartite tricarboxylate transporter TctB family protein n=1 Tax=Marinomonas arenicola TaxID=569601 RepID=UPI00311F9997
MYDRIFAGTLLVLSGLVAWTAYHFDVPFQYEPLGPKAFPILLSATLAMCSIWLIIKPNPNSWHPTPQTLKKILSGLAVMVIYALAFRHAGFIVATTIVATAFSWLFGEKLVKAFLYGLCLSIISYFLLADALQLNVPIGTLFGES